MPAAFPHTSQTAGFRLFSSSYEGDEGAEDELEHDDEDERKEEEIRAVRCGFASVQLLLYYDESNNCLQTRSCAGEFVISRH